MAGTAGKALSYEEWMELIWLASKHGFSAPRISLLGRHEEVDLSQEAAEGLDPALERAIFSRATAEDIHPRLIV